MHNEKSYFGTQNGSLAICHKGVVMIEQWACAIAHTTWPFQCKLAPLKSNETLFVFCHQRVWNFLKSTVEWRFSMEKVVWKCVADGSQGSCPMITSMHGRQFVRSIWTIMLVKKMLFSIELWQKTSNGCTSMNQRVRDNQCSVSKRRLQPTKNSRHRLPLGKSCWPSLGCQWPYIGALPGKGSNCDKCSIQWHASEQAEARDTIETPGGFSQKEHCCFTTPAPIQLRIHWIHYVLSNLRCWNIHHTVRTWRHQIFTCLDLWKNICGARSLQMTMR